MADIQATLVLDDGQYKSKLTNAEKQAKGFGSTFLTTSKSVNGSINSMANGVENLNKKFSSLSSTIVGVGMGALLGNLLSSANALDDMSKSLDVSISRLMEMGVAATQSGSSLEGVQTMLGKMQQAAGDAAQGNQGLIDAFRDVGISLSDLESMSTEEVFLRISQALASIEEPGKRAAASFAIFSKAGRGVDWSSMTQGITDTYGTLDKFGESQKKAAELSQQLAVSLTLIKGEFLNILEPLLGLAPATGDMSDQMERAQTAAYMLAGGLGLLATSAALNTISTISKAAFSLAAAFATSTVSTTAESAALAVNSAAMVTNNAVRAAQAAAKVAALETEFALQAARVTALSGMAAEAGAIATLEKLTWRLAVAKGNAAAATAGAAAASAASVGPVAASGAAAATASRGWMAMAAPILAVTAAIAAVAGVAQSLFGEDGVLNGGSGSNFINDAFESMFGLSEKANESLVDYEAQAKKTAETVAAAMKKAQEAAGGAGTVNAPGDAAKAQEKLLANYREQAAAIARTGQAQKDANQDTLERIKFQTELIGLSKAESASAMAGYEAQKKAKADILSLDEKIAIEREKQKNAKNDTEIKGHQLVIDALVKQKENYQSIAKEVERLTLLEQQRKDAAEMIAFYTEAEEIAADGILALRYEMEDITATESEKRLNAVDRLIEKEKQLAIAKRQSQLGEGELVSAEEQAAISERIDKVYAGIKTKTAGVINQSRQFSTGWNKAMKAYVEDVGNGAKNAENLFKKATSGMEDALVGFAKTGKFEWKTFLADMLEQLLRSQIQEVFASMMGGMQSSMPTTIGGGMGGGNSGMIQNMTGGSSGGLSELLGMAGSLFGGSSGGGGIPVSQGGSGNRPGTGFSGVSASSGIWDTITDTASSLWDSASDLFSGWFATGGQIAAGRYGIVGENGPEMVSGPATITPMGSGGMGGNVTYHINAVDARSFKELLAQDPSYLYALTMQGGQGMPGSRR